MAFERIGIRPAEILLPAPSVNPETWACIACDQYTSEPEYWQKAYETAGDAPSALRLILPEYDLKHGEERIPAIHAAMADYLAKGLLVPAVENGFVLCERSVPGGSRLGLVCTVDLEQYSFEKGSLPLIRFRIRTTTSSASPCSSMTVSAYFSYSAVLSSYKSRSVCPSRSATPLFFILPSLFSIAA